MVFLFSAWKLHAPDLRPGRCKNRFDRNPGDRIPEPFRQPFSVHQLGKLQLCGLRRSHSGGRLWSQQAVRNLFFLPQLHKIDVPAEAQLPEIRFFVVRAASGAGDPRMAERLHVCDAAVLSDGDAPGRTGGDARHDGFIAQNIESEPRVDPGQNLFGIFRLPLHPLLHRRMDDYRCFPCGDRTEFADCAGLLVGRVGAAGPPVFQCLGIQILLIEKVVGVIVPAPPVAASGVEHMVNQSGIFRPEHTFQRHRLCLGGLFCRRKAGYAGRLLCHCVKKIARLTHCRPALRGFPMHPRSCIKMGGCVDHPVYSVHRPLLFKGFGIFAQGGSYNGPPCKRYEDGFLFISTSNIQKTVPDRLRQGNRKNRVNPGSRTIRTIRTNQTSPLPRAGRAYRRTADHLSGGFPVARFSAPEGCAARPAAGLPDGSDRVFSRNCPANWLEKSALRFHPGRLDTSCWRGAPPVWRHSGGYWSCRRRMPPIGRAVPSWFWCHWGPMPHRTGRFSAPGSPHR